MKDLSVVSSFFLVFFSCAGFLCLYYEFYIFAAVFLLFVYSWIYFRMHFKA